MDRVGCPCNPAAINSAINACARVGEWQHALRLLLRMRDLGLAPNVVTWSAVLTACGQGKARSGVIKEVSELHINPHLHFVDFMILVFSGKLPPEVLVSI